MSIQLLKTYQKEHGLSQAKLAPRGKVWWGWSPTTDELTKKSV